MKRHHLILTAILFGIFLLRFPSLFEPFWYGDEGIFAAVARNLNQGGGLYQTAWDNKPPMIYLTYAAIFKFFGVSMFWLHLGTAVVVLATAATIYEIAQATIGTRRALAAAFIFGFLTSLRLIEGNLALTEIFMILPIALAMLIAVKRRFDYVSLVVAGFLIAVASLFKQVGAFEAAALGIFVFLKTSDFWEFIKKGMALSLGFVIPYAATFGYFATKGLVSDYIFGAYTYYRIYLGESPKYAVLINISKILPVVAAILYGGWKKFREKKVEISYLFVLWVAFSFLGSYFSGRTYGHYLVQATPAVSLLLAQISISARDEIFSRVKKARIVFVILFFIPLIFLTRLLFADFLSGGPLNQVKYWQNFVDFARGAKSISAYNDFFDGNVNTVNALADAINSEGAKGSSIYIWGDLPWLYAIVDGRNPVRYVTSFHVFGVPDGTSEVMRALEAKAPRYIIRGQSSIGYFGELEILLGRRYTHLAKIEGAGLYLLKEQ